MILAYHKVHPEEKSCWWVTVDEFYQHMISLQSRQVVTLADYDPENPAHVVITFDGVYDNVHEYATPIMEHFRYPFELFVIGDHIGKENRFDQKVEPPCLFASFEQLEDMARRGGRIQWHTRSHARLNEIGPDQLLSELSIPDEVRKRFPAPHLTWFAYPHGIPNAELHGLIAERFSGALACDDGEKSNPYFYPRKLIVPGMSLSRGKVAAIVANYNYGRYLPEAILSIERQSRKPDEILVIDDASTDNSHEVLDSLETKGYRVVRNEKNLGIVENFRKAVGITTADYLFFLGADNTIRTDFIQECAKALDTGDDVGVAYTDKTVFGDLSGVLGKHVGGEYLGRSNSQNWDVYARDFDDPTPEAIKKFREINFVHGSSMYKRKFYEAVGGYVRGEGPEDHDLFYRMHRAGAQLVHVKKRLLNYRQHSPAQANTSLNVRMENEILRSHLASLRLQLKQLNAEAYDLRRSLYTSRVMRNAAQTKSVDLQYRLVQTCLKQSRASRQHYPGSENWQRHSISRSGIFVSQIYEHLYPDVVACSVDSLSHYIRQGAAEKRSPHPLFDPSYYERQYPEVAAIGINPLVHYTEIGARSGYNPHALFNSRIYLQLNGDLIDAEINPLGHYIEYGWREGRNPHPLFDLHYYLETNSDVVQHECEPLDHFMRYGWREMRNPHPLFDIRYYLEQYPDVANAEINPLIHYLEAGCWEERNPHPGFNTASYLAEHPEVPESGLDPLSHYITNEWTR